MPNLTLVSKAGVMKLFNKIIFAALISAIIFSCSKNGVDKPGTAGPSISSLVYNPSTVTIRQNSTTFTITGYFNFENASGGVSTLRLTHSAGGDITVPISSASITESGQLTGVFEFMMITTPAVITFQVWIIDNKGKSSNKLSGTLQLIIDDSAEKWNTIQQASGLMKVVWGNSKYVSVGNDGKIMTSSNGAVWTSENSGTTNTLYGTVSTGSLYVAVGINKTIVTSPDGVNWTTRSTGVPEITLYSVASSGTGFVAAGYNSATNKPELYYSVNGTDWNPVSLNFVSGRLNAVKWTGNQYIALGGHPKVLTSSNGVDWTDRSSSVSVPGDIWDIVYSGSKYVMVGDGFCALSSDLSNWSLLMTVWGSRSIIWSGNRFVVATYIGIYTSADGTTWTKSSDFNYSLFSIAWSGLQYVAVGPNSPWIIISPP
jgi:hypothetical protein